MIDKKSENIFKEKLLVNIYLLNKMSYRLTYQTK